ncbi:iron complex outermembrane receptor protein [Actimicrobium sp. GrIS 1.19]|uniref:TonB-dependent receptor n=1 Tax=Actimicrobium sp. GrIS 1.19 TaxID=3071708 RepID=UPI002DFC448E|nr:iron complex outermembrane receptor protein [Actimicrobium sp. GrIS 1.19]
MHAQRTLLASAVLSALTSVSFAQTTDKSLQTVTVTAAPFSSNEGDQILAPAKILSGDELRNKLGGSLGDTLSHELGVSSSSFGAGASRPIIRGLEGARVKVLQNGMAVSDVSGLSNDHAVATDGPTAKQIEILRGPAALLYGSGAIGGLVNVVNDRIPTTLATQPTGEAEMRYGTVDMAKNGSLSADTAAGPIGLHVDSSVRNANDYRIPGERIKGDAGSNTGTLPQSFSRQNSVGVGASFIQDWGHIGVSAAQINSRYGIPTLEGSQIEQKQNRYDLDALVNAPFSGFETFKFKLGYTDYSHSELDLQNVPQTNFANRSMETRAELTHAPVAGFHGTFGFQTENTHFSALNATNGAPDTVPVTRSTSSAVFLVEERDLGAVHMNAGLRLESVKRSPVGNLERTFDLTSYSVGGLWNFTPDYGFGATGSIAQRAPSADELYSGGPHDATATFDVGNPNFAKETSRNLELTLQKTKGLIRWKANLFETKARNFVYGQVAGNTVDENGNPGGALRERIFSQGDATIRGGEAEVTYNAHGNGISLRAFADTSHGSLDQAGSLPLQPATRYGVDVGYHEGPWRGGASLLRAERQERLASFETSDTPGYTLLDANLSYTWRVGSNDVTWFANAKNLLNQTVRVSTSLLKDVAPLPGRNMIVGLRTRF